MLYPNSYYLENNGQVNKNILEFSEDTGGIANVVELVGQYLTPGDTVGVINPMTSSLPSLLQSTPFEYLKIEYHQLSDSQTISKTLREAANLKTYCLLNVLEYVTEPGYLLKFLAEFYLQEAKPYLILSVPNIGHRDIAARLLAGNWPFKSMTSSTNKEEQLHFFTAHSLLTLLNKNGWRLVARNDFKQTQSKWYDPDSLLNSSTLVGDWLTNISHIFNTDNEIEEFIWLLEPVSDETPEPTKVDNTRLPLISILIRTQGNRNELLLEALYSVYAQDENDYEVIICFHNNNENRSSLLSELEEVLDALPDLLRLKIRLISATGLGRSVPLNSLLEFATGEYLCFLDDDDLLFPSHISTLKEGIEKYGVGPIFQTYAASRFIKVIGTEEIPKEKEAMALDKLLIPGLSVSTETFPYTVENIIAKWVSPFDPVVQQYHNYVPITCYTIPRRLIEQTNQRFRLDFELGEDWEFLMRISQLLKVVTLPEITVAINIRSNQSNTVNNAELLNDWKSTLNHRLESQVGRPLLLDGRAAQLIYYHHIERFQESEREEVVHQELEVQLQTLWAKRDLQLLEEQYAALTHWARNMEKRLLAAQHNLIYRGINKITNLLQSERTNSAETLSQTSSDNTTTSYKSGIWENKYPLIDPDVVNELNLQTEKHHTLNSWATELDDRLKALQLTQAYRYWQRFRHFK